jgi:hypothetical protein
MRAEYASSLVCQEENLNQGTAMDPSTLYERSEFTPAATLAENDAMGGLALVRVSHGIQSAVTGSIRMARRAGIQAATKATVRRMRSTPACDHGSAGWT